MIVSFKSSLLEMLWTTGDMSLLPNTYVYEVVEILTLLDATTIATDVELLGGFQVQEYLPEHWAVTVTVNNAEPIGSVTCNFYGGNAHQVNLNEFS